MGKVIGVDVDSVVADMATVWLGLYNKDYVDTVKLKDILSWGLHEYVRPDCGFKIYDYLKDKALYNNVVPIKGALEGISALRKKRNRIVYVTSTPIETTGVKYWWLKKWKFITSSKDYIETSDKSLFHGDVLVDDYYMNLLAFTGKMKILFKQPWNKTFEQDDRFLYAKSWKKVVEYINGI